MSGLYKPAKWGCHCSDLARRISDAARRRCISFGSTAHSRSNTPSSEASGITRTEPIPTGEQRHKQECLAVEADVKE